MAALGMLIGPGCSVTLAREVALIGGGRNRKALERVRESGVDVVVAYGMLRWRQREL